MYLPNMGFRSTYYKSRESPQLDNFYLNVLGIMFYALGVIVGTLGDNFGSPGNSFWPLWGTPGPPLRFEMGPGEHLERDFVL